MPYRSEKQRAFMHAKHPAIAKKWDKETGGKIVPTKKTPRQLAQEQKDQSRAEIKASLKRMRGY